MISVAEATKLVLAQKIELETEKVPLAACPGRLLREDLLADRDFPPFDRVMMDGIAFSQRAFAGGQRTFPVAGLQAAGAPQMTLEDPTACLEVMTGAMCPAGTDAVVRYEDLQLENGQATVQLEAVKAWQHIHRQGTDRAKGDCLVPAGRRVSPAEIGVAATVGKTALQVARQVRTVVVSTGDELVEVDETPLAHQIRRSNVHQLAAAVRQWGPTADLLHLPDDPAVMERVLGAALKKYDAVLLSGGVSMGKLDYLPTVLAALGVEKSFHKVKQRPGKPFWFGRAGGGAVVFAFPGNPVSSFMCLHRYFQPWLRASLGWSPFVGQWAVLQQDFSFRPDLTYFLQTQTTFGPDGRLLAQPLAGRGSGDLANLVDNNTFLELPAGRSEFRAGECFPVHFFR